MTTIPEMTNDKIFDISASYYEYEDSKIHRKHRDGFEEWWDQDENGNTIHYINSKGYEYWKEYNSKGKVIYFRNSDGVEEITKYDKYNNIIYFKSNNGTKEKYKYDRKTNECIYYKNYSNGYVHCKEGTFRFLLITIKNLFKKNK